MENEKRLIDANALIKHIDNYYNNSPFPHPGTTWHRGLELVARLIMEAPTVDAVEVNKYEALVGMYHDLRENFVDYVCSGIRNEAPYCLNKCEECVDKRGWCKLEKCQGFNPAEVILDRYANMDAVEVVHGQWEVVHGVLTPGGDPLLRCPICKSRESEHLCGTECHTVWYYCPSCGAKMDGGTENA